MVQQDQLATAGCSLSHAKSCRREWSQNTWVPFLGLAVCGCPRVSACEKGTPDSISIRVSAVHANEMADGREGGGKELAPHAAAAAAADGTGVATPKAGSHHETTSNGGPLQSATPTRAGSVREGDSNGRADEGKALKIGIYGMVNAMMAIPILYGYAAIIFRCVSVGEVDMLLENHT